MTRAERVSDYLQMFKSLDLETRSRLLLTAVIEEEGEWLEIVVRQMNEDSKLFPPRPNGLNKNTYEVMRRIYYGYLKKPGANQIKVYCGDLVGVSHLNSVYNEMCNLLSAWATCPAFHIGIVRKVWKTSKVSFADTVKVGKEYLDKDTNCIYPIERNAKQYQLFSNQNSTTMNRYQKRQEGQKTSEETTTTTDYTEARKLPESMSFYFGDALLTERGNKTFVQIRLNFDKLLKALEDEENSIYKEVVEHAGWETEDGELFMKIKAIPLTDAKKTEAKSHFLTFDYFNANKVKKA